MDYPKTDRERLEAIWNMGPRLQEHLPQDLYAELCAYIIINFHHEYTAEDIARAKEIEEELKHLW